jgi:hypothetical protein
MLNTQDKIETFVTKEFKQELKNCSIIKDGNAILLFDRYKITPNKFGFIISALRLSESHLFYNIKSAVTYCIFEQYQNYDQANQVKNLDRIISNQEFNVELQQKLIKSKNTKEQKMIYLTKLTENLSKKKQAKEQLDKLINISRALLDKKFSSNLK